MEKSFEDALKELEVIVKELESGNVELDSAIDKYRPPSALPPLTGRQ